ncbi:MAG: hypothetical protein AABZ59_07520, partial [Candidatus Binatota bacterium]
VQVKGDPGILPMNVAADDVGVVWGNKAIFLEKARSFGDAVGKQGLDLAPVSAPGNAAGALQLLPSITVPPQGQHCERKFTEKPGHPLQAYGLMY